MCYRLSSWALVKLTQKMYNFDDKSPLVQVMAWCHQATSYYLSQCWPRSMSAYGITGLQCNKLVIFKLISRIDLLNISYEIVLWWMPQDLTDDKSTLVQIMAWCCHAVNKRLPEPVLTKFCDVIWLHLRPQWVKAQTKWPPFCRLHFKWMF